MKITKIFLKKIIKEEIEKMNEVEPAQQGGDVFSRLLSQIEQQATAKMSDQQKAEYEQKKKQADEDFKKIDGRQQELIKAGLLRAQKEKDQNAKVKMYALALQLGALAVPSMFYLSKYILPALGLQEEETK